MMAANLFRLDGHLMDAAVRRNSIGFELAKQGQLINAEENLVSSMELIAKQPHVNVKASICDSLGYLNILTKQYSDAERFLKESAQIFQKIPDKAQLVGTFLHQSELHERKHNRKLARSYAERALKLATETGLQHLCSDAMSRLLSIEASPAQISDRRACFHGLVYVSNQMHSLIAQLKIIAPTDQVVLVLGETGTGKELIARAIHQESKRRAHPFIAFNCSALSPELIESRLFGYRKGAFTGAYADHQGVIPAAAGGRVFLDEIGDLTLEAQGALLRFLDSGEIQPVGAPRPLTPNVRVVCATNRDLKAEAEAKDLYYRLNVATLFVPPLWARAEDIKELARHFARVYSKKFDKPEPVFSREEMACLVKYDWPGNVRELEGHIKRRILFGDLDLGAQASWLPRTADTQACRVLPLTHQRFEAEAPNRQCLPYLFR